jgi:hypothetical protein
MSSMFSVPFLFLLHISSVLPYSYAESVTAPMLGSKMGPVIRTNFMDPCLTQADGIWYAFGGANGNPPDINVQLASSTDFLDWTLHTGYDALPVLGSWANKLGHVWSPDVNQRVCLFFRVQCSKLMMKA